MDTVAHLLDQAAALPVNSDALPVNSDARKRLEKHVLNETEITNFNQVAALVEAVAIHAALENGKSGDEDTAEALFGQAQTISEALRRLHELVQTLA